MIKLFIKITKQNGLRDTKRHTYYSENECLKDMEEHMNNPNYQTLGYHVGEGKEGENKYYLNLKKVG